MQDDDEPLDHQRRFLHLDFKDAEERVITMELPRCIGKTARTVERMNELRKAGYQIVILGASLGLAARAASESARAISNFGRAADIPPLITPPTPMEHPAPIKGARPKDWQQGYRRRGKR